jgi:hypothetical protein
MEPLFEHEFAKIIKGKTVYVWPGAHISPKDGCAHLRISEIINSHIYAVDIIVMPNREYHCMVG